jgi:drug/metabolite transporter (DMT)-like permease
MSSGLVALAVGAAAIGTSPILVRLADVGPVAIAFWRLVLALPILFLWHQVVRWRRPAGTVPPTGAVWPLILSGLFFAGDLSIWHVSLRHTSLANSIFLFSAATPLYATLAGRIFLGQRVGRNFILGMALAVLGAGLLVAGRGGLGGGEWLGDLLAVMAAACFAGYLIAVAKCRAIYPAATISLVGTFVSAVLVLPVSLALGETFMPGSGAGWIDLAALGLICQAGAQTLIGFGLAFVAAGLSSLVLLLEPVVSVLLAWPILDEAPNALQIAGCVAILGGIWVARRGGAAAPALP